MFIFLSRVIVRCTFTVSFCSTCISVQILIFKCFFVKVGKIPAQTQLQTALAINMGSEGKQVEITLAVCFGNMCHFQSQSALKLLRFFIIFAIFTLSRKKEA